MKKFMSRVFDTAQVLGGAGKLIHTDVQESGPDVLLRIVTLDINTPRYVGQA